MLKKLSLLFACLLVFCQLNSQKIQPTARKGWIFGTSFGRAYSILNIPDKDLSQGGLAIDLKIGYMLKSDLGLLITSNVSIYDYEGFGRPRKRDFGVLAPSVQYWFNKKVWALGGVGLGGDNPVFWDIKSPENDPLETKYYNGLGLVAAVGYEVLHFDKCIVDLKAKVTYRNVNIKEGNSDGTSFAILVGIDF